MGVTPITQLEHSAVVLMCKHTFLDLKMKFAVFNILNQSRTTQEQISSVFFASRQIVEDLEEERSYQVVIEIKLR